MGKQEKVYRRGYKLVRGDQAVERSPSLGGRDTYRRDGSNKNLPNDSGDNEGALAIVVSFISVLYFLTQGGYMLGILALLTYGAWTLGTFKEPWSIAVSIVAWIAMGLFSLYVRGLPLPLIPGLLALGMIAVVLQWAAIFIAARR